MLRRRLLAPFLLAALPLLSGVARGKEDEAPPDAFARALEDLHLGEGDLGYRPQGHWNRVPEPSTTPYVLPFFSDLFAHPLDTYAFTRTLGNTVEDLLTPESLTAAPTKKDRKETLYRLGVLLGTERRIGGFRGYSANLDPRPVEKDPLVFALATLLERSGKPLDRPMTFGGEYEEGEKGPLAELKERVDVLPEPLRLPLARLVLNLVQAHEWIDKGLRRVSLEQREEVFRVLPGLTDATPDGTEYFPVLDDVAHELDEYSLYYGCLKALQATQDARRELGAVPVPEKGWPAMDLRVQTPWGTVAVVDGSRHDVSVSDPLLVVDVGGGRPVASPFGATAPRRSHSVGLLLGEAGRVGWLKEGVGGRKIDEVAGLAAGILGCGIVYGAGEHDTTWTTGKWGLGAGLFGLGALVDEGGDDTYHMRSAGEGAGYFGAGLLLDAAGDDAYELWEGDGQGLGGPGGIGVLGDRSGNDTYRVEPDAAKAGRGDYHSEGRIASSNAQGAGFGRRGDGSDGHAWAGGLGALLDVDGDDHYVAGNFSQGIGYWFGTGLLWDGGGNDRYDSVYFTQGSGAHFAIGALIDEGGDDVHVLTDTAGAAFGFGWDMVNAFLIDRGKGNDRYEAVRISIGMAEVRSNAFFLDEGGDDTYVLGEGQQGFGQVDERETYEKPGRTRDYDFRVAQVAIFLDLGGKDTYLRRPRSGGEPVPDADAKDEATWHLAAKEAGKLAGPNVSLGRDTEGRLGFLDPWPARVPKKETPGASDKPR